MNRARSPRGGTPRGSDQGRRGPIAAGSGGPESSWPEKGKRPEPADREATATNAAISATGSRNSPIKPHFTNDIAGNPCRRCWRRGRDRLWSALSDLRRLSGASHWISSVACLHNSAGTDFRSADCSSAGWPTIPWSGLGSRELARRVRYLHHHFPGACGVYFSPPAQCVGPARPAASARPTIPIPPVMPCAARTTMSLPCRAAVAKHRRLPRRLSIRKSAGRASRSRARPSPPASTPSRRVIRHSTPSISSLARGRRTR